MLAKKNTAVVKAVKTFQFTSLSHTVFLSKQIAQEITA